MSTDTLDVDDYLKPTFDKFDLILNPRDMSPPSEAPPPIPTVSYARSGGATPVVEVDGSNSSSNSNNSKREENKSPNVTEAEWKE